MNITIPDHQQENNEDQFFNQITNFKLYKIVKQKDGTNKAVKK